LSATATATATHHKWGAPQPRYRVEPLGIARDVAVAVADKVHDSVYVQDHAQDYEDLHRALPKRPRPLAARQGLR
jgi:hypothetical protein